MIANSATISAYDWASLERISRHSLALSRQARRSVARAVKLSELAAAASAVIETDVKLVVHGVVEVAVAAAAPQGSRLAFLDALGGSPFELELSPELVSEVLSRVLGRKPKLAFGREPLEPALSGAIAAVVIEIARRTRSELALAVRTAPPQSSGQIAISAGVSIAGRPYAARVFVHPTGTVAPTLSHTAERAQLIDKAAGLPISVPLVVGIATLSRQEFAELEPGDAFLPGGGWLLESQTRGPTILAAPNSELGLGSFLMESGEVVLRGHTIPLADGGDAMTDETASPATTEMILEAPIVVRVELGTVTLKAREWAELEPGDVIETGRRVGGPVVLRVAGQEVARGELVNIDGELGVRIGELYSDESTR